MDAIGRLLGFIVACLCSLALYWMLVVGINATYGNVANYKDGALTWDNSGYIQREQEQTARRRVRSLSR
jgi:hypothetical protein